MGNLKNLHFPKKLLQTCPICTEPQPIIVHGLTKDIQDNNTVCKVPDRGYSFCDCNNIFFTDWKNTDQEVYDEDYKDKYSSELYTKSIGVYAETYFPRIDDLNPYARDFLEIGSINPVLLDACEEYGWNPTANDINPSSKSEYEFLCGDFESIEIEKTFDIIFASHVFEHFKDPIEAVNKCYNMLNDKGVLFIAMPDPFYIDWSNPYLWGHWWITEHHILWDMYSFCKVLTNAGFKLKYKLRNTGGQGFICSGDFHLVVQK